MISKVYRIVLYTCAIFVMAIIGTAIIASSIAIYWGVTFALLSLIFFTIIELNWGLKQRTNEPIVDVIYGEDALKKVYKSMRRDRDCTYMRTIWCTHYANVQKYFKDEREDFNRNDRLNIQRLINPYKVNAQPKDFETHINRTKDLANNGRYSVAATDLDEIECVICDYERMEKKERKALFVFNDRASNTPKLGILLDPAKDNRTSFAVDSLKSWFDKEWKKGNEIIILEE